MCENRSREVPFSLESSIIVSVLLFSRVGIRVCIVMFWSSLLVIMWDAFESCYTEFILPEGQNRKSFHRRSMLALFSSLFIAKITIFLGDSKLQTFFTANRLLPWNKLVIYSWKLPRIISCHSLLPPEVNRLHVAFLQGAKVMIHWGNQMVSVDGRHPLQQYSVVSLLLILPQGFTILSLSGNSCAWLFTDQWKLTVQ